MNDDTTGNCTDLYQARGCCRAPNTYDSNDRVFEHRCCKLDEFDWLKQYSISSPSNPQIVEVRFKNGRKDYFSFTGETILQEGDFVAVEAASGHDIGIVTLTGEIVKLQMKRKKISQKPDEMKKIYRQAKVADVEKWMSAIELEGKALFRTRSISYDLKLDMKLNDVEYQGDKTKAVFYYTAEDRVDFRELIKRLAEEFHIRIEMRQIGMRQEAAKLGGIGSCGRELCCASWMSEFQSVSTGVARIQQLSPNPQKLAGQCGKLKCCLNYEYEAYADAYKNFPDERTILKTKKGDAIYQKSDIFKGLMWYSYSNDRANLMAIPIDKVKEIAAGNSKGVFPEALEDFAFMEERQMEFGGNNNMEGDLNRFD